MKLTIGVNYWNRVNKNNNDNEIGKNTDANYNGSDNHYDTYNKNGSCNGDYDGNKNVCNGNDDGNYSENVMTPISTTTIVITTTVTRVATTTATAWRKTRTPQAAKN